MTLQGDKPSGAESLRQTRSFGKVRCHNPSCMGRLEPEAGAVHIKCSTCGMEYRLFWVNPRLPRIRGPVWRVNREIAEAKMTGIRAAETAPADGNGEG